MHDTQRSDGRGVTPVIGIVLLVAITTILAAAVGVLVIDTGDSQATVPQATFEITHNGTHATVAHDGGQAFDASNTARLAVRVDGTTENTFDVADEVVAGDEVAVPATSGDTVTVVWVGPKAEQSHVVEEFVVP